MTRTVAPFKVGDVVSVDDNSTWVGQKVLEPIVEGDYLMLITKIEWVGDGENGEPEGCESGWLVSAHVNNPSFKGERDLVGYDSGWFIKESN